MLISVIIPTYNRSALVLKAIESVNNQTYNNIEIIVVDDGSTDDTEKIIESYKISSRFTIVYYKKENGGCASSRNAGIILATGDLISFLDSDDVFLLDALGKLKERLVETNADFVYSPVIEIFENGDNFINYPSACDNTEKLAEEHFKQTNVRNGSVLFKKEIFNKLGGLDESLKHNEDSDFLQRVAISFKAAYLNIPTVKILNHKNNKSNNRIAINYALLKSAENISITYPDFVKKIEKEYYKRINQIRIDLINELIKQNFIKEAIENYHKITTEIDTASIKNIIVNLIYHSNFLFSFKLFFKHKLYFSLFIFTLIKKIIKKIIIKEKTKNV